MRVDLDKSRLNYRKSRGAVTQHTTCRVLQGGMIHLRPTAGFDLQPGDSKARAFGKGAPTELAGGEKTGSGRRGKLASGLVPG